MDILFVSHCVPNPPNKGEKIRAFHSVKALAKDFRVHLACLARGAAEVQAAQELSDVCASVYAQPLARAALPAAAARFFLGGACLNREFYSSSALARHIEGLCGRVPIRSAVAFSVVMAPYIPAAIPCVLDMQDVDSEKWYQYAKTRRPALPYRVEADRLRREEIAWARASAETVFTTRNEEALFRGFAPEVRTSAMENGVDSEFFDPAAIADDPALAGRRYVVFTGTMDYWPNIDAAQWFATRALPELRRSDPRMEFFIVGRNPPKAVRDLAGAPGVVVTGGVADIRPYLKHCACVVTPLRIARGIQNKVLEALAMGKAVLASSAVCRTFGERVPGGVTACDSEADYARELGAPPAFPSPEQIRAGVRDRFDWEANLQVLTRAVAGAAAAGVRRSEKQPA